MSHRHALAMLCAIAFACCGDGDGPGSGAVSRAQGSSAEPGDEPLLLDRDELRLRLQSMGVDDGHAEALVDLARPCLQFRAASGARPEPCTRWGGNPWLPTTTHWPERGGVALAFLAQLRLDELPAEVVPGLPESGLLSFFYVQDQSVWGHEESDHDGWRVLFHANVGACVERRPPSDVESHARYRAVPQLAAIATSLPNGEHPDVAALGMTAGQLDVFSDFVHSRSNGLAPDHQLGGYDLPIQWTSKPGPDWILLLQLDSDEAPGWMWGDVGCLYFWIEREALERSDFSGVHMELQCS